MKKIYKNKPVATFLINKRGKGFDIANILEARKGKTLTNYISLQESKDPEENGADSEEDHDLGSPQSFIFKKFQNEVRYFLIS